MSTINQFPTFHYSQPNEYRLSHDSVFIARKVFEITANVDMNQYTLLDICAGCGIVGMDFLFHRRSANLTQPREFDFLEVQEIYIEHFNKNLMTLGDVQTKLNFINENYNVLQSEKHSNKYNLITCQPPYFLIHQGKLSPSEFKNRCRFFIDSDLNNLILSIQNCLKPNGQAYLLLRDLTEHGINIINQTKEICADTLLFKIIGNIRGAHFITLTKK